MFLLVVDVVTLLVISDGSIFVLFPSLTFSQLVISTFWSSGGLLTEA